MLDVSICAVEPTPNAPLKRRGWKSIAPVQATSAAGCMHSPFNTI